MDNERIKKHYINSLSKFLPEDIKNNFDIDWDGYNVNIDNNAECDYGTVTGKDGIEGAYFEFTNKSNPEERYSVTYGIVGNFTTWQTEDRPYDRNGDPGDPGDMGDYEFTDFDDEATQEPILLNANEDEINPTTDVEKAIFDAVVEYYSDLESSMENGYWF